jgi:hypothetical protein
VIGTGTTKKINISLKKLLFMTKRKKYFIKLKPGGDRSLAICFLKMWLGGGVGAAGVVVVVVVVVTVAMT